MGIKLTDSRRQVLAAIAQQQDAGDPVTYDYVLGMFSNWHAARTTIGLPHNKDAAAHWLVDHDLAEIERPPQAEVLAAIVGRVERNSPARHAPVRITDAGRAALEGRG